MPGVTPNASEGRLAVTFTHFKVEFTRDGAIFDHAQVDQVLGAVPGLTDLIVISHGWNNNVQEATDLYDAFFKSVDALLGVRRVAGRFAGPLAGRAFGVVRVYWPSKKFAPADLIPAGGVASAGTGGGAQAKANAATLLGLLEKLKHDPLRLGGTETDPDRVAAMDRAKGLVPTLETDPHARREFVATLRSILDQSQAHPDDGSTDFFRRDPLELFQDLSGAVVAAPPPNPGGAASFKDLAGAVGGAVGGAVNAVGGAVNDVVEGAQAAARRLANFATYSTMKERAGTVGRGGAAELLRRVRERKGDLKLHLVGHSFGGRLVTALASTLAAGTPATMTLLQAAYSHNGLGEKYDQRHDGSFRAVLKERRITGPVIITHTKNDWAVGIAYPLASRIARDTAAAFGDENDPYGGMGRNGAQHTPEVQTPAGTLQAVGRDYTFAPGTVYNLRADEFIMDHGDVTGHQVAYAFLHAIATL
jgi:pimeloyl-ACP methyl ester carboxylesterase